MNLIIDATALDLYPVGKSGFHGGTELYLHKLAEGLAKNHIVHVVTADLSREEQRGERLWYWPKAYHPTSGDAIIMFHSLENIEPYSSDLLVLASNGLGAYLGPEDEYATGVDAVACFSKVHADLLHKAHPKLRTDRFFITGLGVDVGDYSVGFERTADGDVNAIRFRDKQVPGRMLYANDPQRGLLNTLRVFELVRKEVPEATLHVTYDWERVFQALKWNAHCISEELWECNALMKTIPGVSNLGALTRQEVIREELECSIHAYPSNPPNVGSQIHGITQMECAAAGAALVLSDVEAFPEVFGEAAYILPTIGSYLPEDERRCNIADWADVIISLIREPEEHRKASVAARALAERNTWDHVVHRWNKMLSDLTGKTNERLAQSS